MKKIYTISKFAGLMLLFSLVWNQQLNAQASVCFGEEVCITLPTTLRGTIQWQQSADNITWSTVAGETNDTICVTPSLTGYFRAEISEGTCDPLYSASVSVIVNAAIVADAGLDQSYCDGGTVNIGGSPAASGGTAPYTYSWSPAAGLSNDTIGNPIVSTTVTTTYYLTVTDAAGCFGTDSVVVTVNPTPAADAGLDQIINCSSSGPLGGSPAASGGTAPYTYSWTPAFNLNSYTVANPTFVPGSSTNYQLLVSDVNGCTASDSVSVTVIGSPGSGTQDYLLTGAQQIFVVPACVASVTLSTWGGEGGSSANNTGGLGGYSTGTLAVTPGETLYVYVGGKGQNYNFNGGIDYEALGGWNGGGNGGYDNSGQVENGGAGGGGTDVRQGGTALSNRVIVAGGGGGSAGGFFNPAHGGNGGGTSGDVGGFTYTAVGGTGGTQSAGGVANTLLRGATDGTLGQGGNGSTNQNAWGSGGGGGGYYGGGGGTSTQDHPSGHAAAGGGGSGYIGGVASGSMTNGIWTGDGKVTITW